MNFDKARVLQVIDELIKLQAREDQLWQELQAAFGGAQQAKAAVAKAKPKAKGKKKGQLQDTVLKVLKGYTSPVTLTVLSKAVNKQRANTKPAAVASVLHSLAKRGTVIKNAPDVFYLPQNTSAPEPPKASAPVEELES